MEDPGTPQTSPVDEAATAALSNGATLLIWGVRQWLVAARERHCIKRALMIPYYRMNCLSAIYPLDALMRRLAEGAERKIQIRSPEADRLSADEQLLLLLVRSAQQQNQSASTGQAHRLVRGSQAQHLESAASEYAKALARAGLNLSSPPQLTLLDGAGS